MLGFAILITLFVFFIGVISIIVPLRRIGIKTRFRGLVLALAAFFMTALLGSQVEPKGKPSAKPSSTTEVEALKSAENTPTSAPSPAPALKAISFAPADQTAFIEAIDRHRSAYQSAKNDMAKGAQRPARARSLCMVLRDRKIADWTGYVTTLTTNSDGFGVVTIELGPKVSVGTWNNALSDVADETLIDPNSRVFTQAVNLAEGAAVKFSGRLFWSQTDCVHEKSMTMDGSMRSPEFLIRFTAIRPLEGVEPKRRSSILKRLFD